MVVIAGLIVIGLIVYFIIVPTITASLPTNANKPVTAALPVTNTPPTVNANLPNVPPPAEVTPETAQASTARTVAIAFAERFATYSNQNGLANLDNLEAISTPSVWSFIKGGYRSDLLKTMPKASSYYAMTSTALNANVSPVSATEVNATVMMQRVESGTSSKVAYGTLDLKLKKVGEAWLVSWEEWEK
jgi:hypothetical protein